MKKILYYGVMIMLSTIGLMSTELNVTVDKIDTTRGGDIRVYVFKEKGFPKVHKEALMFEVKVANKEELSFTFEVPDDVEELAIKLFHDENSDGKVTKNWTGFIPKEGLGFSNNQEMNFGPPSYKDCKLSKEEFKNKQTISVIYP